MGSEASMELTIFAPLTKPLTLDLNLRPLPVTSGGVILLQGICSLQRSSGVERKPPKSAKAQNAWKLQIKLGCYLVDHLSRPELVWRGSPEV
jgi:hypothetical protein